MRMYLVVIFFISFKGFGQFQKTDSLGNFYVIEHQLVWQKWYEAQDKASLNAKLKNNEFTSGLDILKFSSSAKTKSNRLSGNNLPEYARHDYDAFLAVDFIRGRYRVSVKQIIFPDFIEKVYYNGVRQDQSRGTLEQYILRRDGLIKRNGSTINVLNSFDTEFSKIFDPMAAESAE